MPRIIWCARTLPSRCPTRRTGFFTRRSGLCAVRDFHRLWFFEIYNGFGVRSLESARFSAGRVDSGRSSHVVYGLCAVGDIQHRRDVCTVVPLRLVPWMGWPPCGRTMVHWWSQKERGGIVSVWNCAHNVGGGSRHCCSCWGWLGLTTGKRRSICQPLARLWWRCSLSQ